MFNKLMISLIMALFSLEAVATNCPTGTTAPTTWTLWTGPSTSTAQSTTWTSGQILIPIGTANAGTGATLFTAFTDVNCMFADLYGLTVQATGTKIDGSKINAGSIPYTAINASGTASSTTVLYGNGTWASVTGTANNAAGNQYDIQYNSTGGSNPPFGGAGGAGTTGIFSYTPSTSTMYLGGYNGSTTIAGTLTSTPPATTSTAGSALTIVGGPGGTVNGAGGNLNLKGGVSSGARGGGVAITSGTGSIGSGLITLTVPTTTSGNGSNIALQAGNTSFATGNGGAVTVKGGAALGATGGDGGAVGITGGSASGTGSGGDVTLTAGYAGSASTGAASGGSVAISAGGSLPGSSVSTGPGSIQFYAGYNGNSSTCTTCGLIQFIDSTDTTIISIGPGYMDSSVTFSNQGCTPLTTGTTYTISHNLDNCLVLNGPTSMTVTMPASPHDGEQVEVLNGGTATVTLNVNPNTGQTVNGGSGLSFTTTSSSYRWQYSAASSRWARH